MLALSAALATAYTPAIATATAPSPATNPTVDNPVNACNAAHAPVIDPLRAVNLPLTLAANAVSFSPAVNFCTTSIPAAAAFISLNIEVTALNPANPPTIAGISI